jgi:hypothetical protein
MRLALPGLVRDGRVFCCHGCAKGEALQPPAKTRTVSAARAVHIDRTPEEVARFLADIDYLHLYEQKLARIHVTAVSADGRRACATADGQFANLTYHIELHFDALEGGGYNSTLCADGPIVGLRGTFAVRPDGEGCVVTHVERYEFKGGTVGARVGAIVRPYIGWSMARELRTLKRLVEDPAALAEALRGGDPRTIPVDPRVKVWDPSSHRPPKRGWLARVPTPHTVELAGAFAFGLLLGWRLRRTVR